MTRYELPGKLAIDQAEGESSDEHEQFAIDLCDELKSLQRAVALAQTKIRNPAPETG